MPRHFFRRLALKRDRFRGKWFLAPFDHLLHDHNLWGIRRRTIVPAFAIGIFVGFLPIPGHPLIAALIALAIGVNIPVAALTTFISNPLTMGPMYLLGHRLGLFLLGMEPQPFEFELSFQWLQEKLSNNWQPLVLGCLLLASVASLVGYVILDLLWRASIADYLARKRKRKQKGPTNV